MKKRSTVMTPRTKRTVLFIAHGRLHVRHGDCLMVYDIRRADLPPVETPK